MKWVLLITLIMADLLTASPINKTIDELLNNEEERLEIPQYDPFRRAKPLLVKKLSKRPVYKPAPVTLIAVLNDKAFINGKWYKNGDLLSEGKLIKITDESVYLKKGNKIKILRLKKEKSLLKISEKDHR
jgi:hypothetical protein